SLQKSTNASSSWMIWTEAILDWSSMWWSAACAGALVSLVSGWKSTLFRGIEVVDGDLPWRLGRREGGGGDVRSRSVPKSVDARGVYGDVALKPALEKTLQSSVMAVVGA